MPASGGYDALLDDLRQHIAAQAKGDQQGSPGLRPDELRAQAAGDQRLLVRSFPGRAKPAPAPPPPPRRQIVVVRPPTREETFAKACANRDDILAKAMAAFHAGHLTGEQVIMLEIATNDRLAALADGLPT